MARRQTIDLEALQALGAPRLAELLAAAVAHDPAAKRHLRLEIAAAAGPRAAASEIRKRLAAIGRAKKFVPRSGAAAVADDLETQREAIESYVTEKDPALALDLLWRFMGLAERVFDRCDDSYGLIGGVFRSALANLGRAASVARPDPIKLAGKVFDALWTEGFGQYDGLIGEVGPALGETGLEHLRKRVLAFRDSLDSANAEAPNAPDDSTDNVVAGPWGGSGRGIPDPEVVATDSDPSLVLRYTIPQALVGIADAQGDVDAFMEQYDAKKRKIPVFAAEIARRLLRANRSEEALAILDEARLVGDDGWSALDEEWREARIDVLEALGRGEEAQAARWETFEKTLDREMLRAYLERLDAAETAAATEKALDHVAGYPEVHAALDFMLDWPDRARAAEILVRRERELNGDYYSLFKDAAAALAAEYPLAATLALRAMIDFTMANARSSRYRHAARQLLVCRGLAEKIDDYRGFEDHDTYFAAVREENARKSKFWAVFGEVLAKAASSRP